MTWKVYDDENGNTYWECPIRYTGEKVLYYRIIQILKNNNILFVENSSDELLMDRSFGVREEWLTIQDAKYDMYRHYRELQNEQI